MKSKVVTLGLAIVVGMTGVGTIGFADGVTAQTVDARKVEADRKTLEDAKRFLAQGNRQLDTKEFSAALQSFQQSLEIYQQLKNLSGMGQAYRGLGASARMLKQFDQAIVYHQKTLEIARKIGDRELELTAFNSFMLTYSSLGNDKKVVEFAQLSSALARNLKRRSEEGGALAYLADSYAGLNEHQKAIEFGQQSLAISKEMNITDLEVTALDVLTRAYSSLGEHQKAVEFGQQGLILSRQLKTPVSEGRALAFLANSYAYLNEYEKAIEFGKQSIRVAKESKKLDVELLALRFMTFTYTKFQQHQAAIESATQAITIAKQINQPIAEGYILSELNITYRQLGNIPRAIEVAQQAVSIAREQKNLELDLSASALLTVTYAELKSYVKAIESVKQVVRLARQLKRDQKEKQAISSLENLFSAQLKVKEYQSVIASAQEWLIEGQKSNQLSDQVLALSVLGVAHTRVNNSKMADDLIQQAETIARQLRPAKAQLPALINVLGGYHLMGKAQQAEALALEIKSMAEQTQDSSIILEVSGELASYQFVKSGNLAESFEQFLNMGLERNKNSIVNSEIAKKNDTENAFLLGMYIFFSEDIFKIEKYKERYLATVRQTKDQDLELVALMIQAMAAWKTDPQKIEAATDQFLMKVRDRQDSMWSVGGLLIASIFLYPESGNHQKSIENIEKFLEIKLDANAMKLISADTWDDITDLASVPLATAYGKSGNSKKAIAILQKNSFSINQKLRVPKNLEQKKELLDNQVLTLSLLADSYRLVGQQENAMKTYQEALTLSRSLGKSEIGSASQRTLLASYVGLARIYQSRDMPVIAITYYKLAISELEQSMGVQSVEQMTAFSDTEFSNKAFSGISRGLKQMLLKRGTVADIAWTKIADVYRELADLLLSQGRIGEAQQVLELLKIQEINDITKGTRSTTTIAQVPLSTVEKEIIEKYNSLIEFGEKLSKCEQTRCADLDSYRAQRKKLTTAYNTFVKTIIAEKDENRRTAIDKGTETFISSAEEIVTAQPDTILIYPLVLKDKTRILWAAKGGVLSQAECPLGEAQLSKLTEQFRTALQTSDDLNPVQTSGKALYECLIPKKLQTELTKNKIKNLVFVPDRVTNYIPMAALHNGKQYLIETFAISNILATRFTDTQDKLPKQPSILGFGLSQSVTLTNPTRNFSPLPFVPSELSGILKTAKKDSSTWLDRDFTQKRLEDNLLDKPNILHFATHGEFNTTDPRTSYLLLGDGTPFKISDIQYLTNLSKVHLVVLSACETALGGSDNGSEIAGIASYFLGDGSNSKAKAVLASLWKVNDPATSILMTDFYKTLSQTNLTKTKALQQVQIQMINSKLTLQDAADRAGARRYEPDKKRPQNLSHPYYWAPFILIGNSL